MTMKVYDGNEAEPAERNSILTIGTFDGVHKGHQAVLRAVGNWARPEQRLGGVLTFREHPRKTLGLGAPDLVTTLEHRLVLFEREKIDFTWVLDFTPELARMSAREFAEEFFVRKLRIQGLVMGFDSCFGSDRLSKDSPELDALAADLRFEVRCVPAVLSAEGEIVSSTLIREAINEGHLDEAESMLGRHVSVYGTVIAGDGRGRRLGYHTANLDLSREVRPPFGVYATVTWLGGRRYGSITNVGYRPTLTQEPPAGYKPDLLIETHLFDMHEDLYGQKMEVQFIEKLRDERRFPDVLALVEQIKKDEVKARTILAVRNVL